MIDKLLGPKHDAYVGFIRRQMIKDQIEARGVKDQRVLAAMDKVCRHCFVPEGLATRAYDDYPIPIERGQTVSQPYIVALMSELLALKGGEKVLEIGTGSGYQTAVLAELAADGHTAWLGRVLELSMATLCHYQSPSIVFQHPNNLTNLHPVTLPEARQILLSGLCLCRRTWSCATRRSTPLD